ncbi:MAG: hypothetical protein U7126_05905 [Microcoleus sp.]
METIETAEKLPATADLPPHTTVAKAKTIPAVGVKKILGKKVGIRYYLFGILSIVAQSLNRELSRHLLSELP